MSGDDQEWVKAAMNDDSMVVELLVRLHRAPSSHLKPKRSPLKLTVRQRMSKPVPITNFFEKTGARASPTTPLSWSGATSFNGGCADGGVEESSGPSKLSNLTRSKATENDEKTTFKRSRKKKTLAELKEEENRLVKERKNLKRDIAALRINLENEKARNESLKRVKSELQPLYDRIKSQYDDAKSGDIQKNITSCHSIPPTIPPIILGHDAILQYSITKQKEIGASNPKFLLPDLNMPLEEEHSPAVACKVN